MSEEAKDKGAGKTAHRKKKGKKMCISGPKASCLGDPWLSPSRGRELTSPMEAGKRSAANAKPDPCAMKRFRPSPPVHYPLMMAFSGGALVGPERGFHPTPTAIRCVPECLEDGGSALPGQLRCLNPSRSSTPDSSVIYGLINQSAVLPSSADMTQLLHLILHPPSLSPNVEMGSVRASRSRKRPTKRNTAFL
ncbi:hypothetical protein P4O66_001425 [Electrophorus voltai]|uniref:Uncharacterized protein n=1 Tax=Electrophorus voltai TaxID=2609070 RepID=A0AAD8Z758_9TELE|nr:hypothetical protein P4O66_001425 [Electrophorus voltai]